jgi:thiamine biosynthesis lipoprotein
MKHTQLIMGMPITIEINGPAKQRDLATIFDYFLHVDKRYSTYKPDSEVSLYNAGKSIDVLSSELQFVLELCEKTRIETNGYFNIKKLDGSIDPSGLVKGWAIQNAANQLYLAGWDNFYIEAGGDVFAAGVSPNNKPWKLGIRNPFKINEIIKVLNVSDCGVATSGNYIRGNHIYNPKSAYTAPRGIVSITVVGPNIYEADCIATAAFAMGKHGIAYIEQRKGMEGYMVTDTAIATFTTGFEAYVA